MDCPVDFIKINENKARITALFVLVLGLIYLKTGFWLIIAFLLVDFVLRATNFGKYSLLGFISDAIIKQLNIKPKMVDRAPKRFAAMVGALFTAAILISFILQLPIVVLALTIILSFFAFLESFFAFCAGCYVYSAGKYIASKVYIPLEHLRLIKIINTFIGMRGNKKRKADRLTNDKDGEGLLPVRSTKEIATTHLDALSKETKPESKRVHDQLKQDDGNEDGKELFDIIVKGMSTPDNQ